ncbi:MAG: VCBS repeat-containing protein [Saprospiraceae bacterium]|nr:VCBS repeat-containing protein [Saprospiraceae bacterium]
MKVFFSWIFVAFFCLKFVSGQNIPAFVNKAKILKADQQTRGIIPSAMVDIDGDLIDDIVTLDKGFSYKVFFGNHYNLPLTSETPFIFPHYYDAFGLAVGDLNSDGKNDFVSGGSFGYLSVLLSQGQSYLHQILPTDFLVQTINLIDVNNDDLLDIFVCNDDGPNIFYINTDNNTFFLEPNIIDFKTTPISDMSGNYGSVWVDVNKDNKMDLAIAKCRAGVSSPTDPRRINVLYLQDSLLHYSEKGVSYGFNLGQQSWAVTFGDYDNDGDADAYVINHYEPHVFLENINGQYFQSKNITDNPLNEFSFQAVSRDFDNDGLLDIVLSGVSGISFLHNKGGLLFERVTFPDFPLEGLSMVLGDVNDDGFIDIHSQSPDFNTVTSKEDKLYINQGNTNNFFKCNLEGVTSNKSAVGTVLHLYGDWGVQMRQVSAGESYGITNSFQQHFGLGASDQIDSMVVYWPSGNRQVCKNLTVNSTWFIQENNCSRQVVSLYEDPLVLLQGDSILISAPDKFLTYNWSNGFNTREVFVKETGSLFVRLTDSTGCVTYTKPILVSDGCFQNGVALLDYPKSITQCAGDILNLQSAPAKNYAWNTGAKDQSIMITESGLYSVTGTDYCGITLRDSVLVTFENVISPVIHYKDTVSYGQDVTFVSDNEQTTWIGSDALTILSEGKTFSLSEVSRDTFIYARTFNTFDAFSEEVGIKTFPPFNQYGANSTNGGLIFSAEKPFVIESIRVYTDTPGKRKIIISNSSSALIFLKEFDLLFGENILNMEAEIEKPGRYTLTTDENTNLSSLGFKGPRFLRHSTSNLSYPYSVDNVVSITNSTSGFNYYYYFYDWKVRYGEKTCYSALQKLNVMVDTTSNTIDEEWKHGKPSFVLPNPFSDEVVINAFSYKNDFLVEIYSGTGQLVYSNTHSLNRNVIYTSAWPSGIYFFRISKGDQMLNCHAIKK